MDKEEIEFEFELATKNTYRFQEMFVSEGRSMIGLMEKGKEDGRSFI